jgi:hypothetical protein
MRRRIPSLALWLAVATPVFAGDAMVYTAHQEWPSRIYVLRMNGAVHHYFEYEFCRFNGVEVVNGEFYVAEAFAPRVYKVDLLTGDLDVFIDDWSLFYFYDVAFDGTYFYVDEWDLNRYDKNGDFDSRAGFDEDVLGSAFADGYYWTLNDANRIRCWDLTGWPSVVEVPENAFTPPTPECRGLWFDGLHFWSAESKNVLGLIYKFDANGNVVRQWTEPAFSGWGACVVPDFATGVRSVSAIGGLELRFEPISPNPTRTHTTIRFALPRSAHARLSLHDASGRLVSRLLAGELGPGHHDLPWNAGALANGVYFWRLEAGGETISRKMVVSR